MTDKQTYLIGVISDTHGHLPKSVSEVFSEVDAIVHAGDIGGSDVLTALNELAPLYAVRGNMDGGDGFDHLSGFEVFNIGDISIYTLHDLTRLDLDPAAAGIDAVVSGHTHRPDIHYQKGVLYLNPGSASFPRHHHPPTVALLTAHRPTLDARIIELTR